jgi:lipoprotein-anchoring transpeptidase ErfK/SrfK
MIKPLSVAVFALVASASASTGALAFDNVLSGSPPVVDPRYQGSISEGDVGQELPSATREEVEDPTGAAPGSIVIDSENKVLYFTLGGGRAIRYQVGVGRPGFEWHGKVRVGRKAEWPGWTPPEAMLERRPDLPRHMAGGIDNPLGARALYLYQGRQDTMFRIHGTNEADTIGQAVSSGCIRMLNDDVTDLYERVKVGTPVVVM